MACYAIASSACLKTCVHRMAHIMMQIRRWQRPRCLPTRLGGEDYWRAKPVVEVRPWCGASSAAAKPCAPTVRLLCIRNAGMMLPCTAAPLSDPGGRLRLMSVPAAALTLVCSPLNPTAPLLPSCKSQCSEAGVADDVQALHHMSSVNLTNDAVPRSYFRDPLPSSTTRVIRTPTATQSFCPSLATLEEHCLRCHPGDPHSPRAEPSSATPASTSPSQVSQLAMRSQLVVAPHTVFVSTRVSCGYHCDHQ